MNKKLDPSKVALGKKDYLFDARTLRVMNVVDKAVLPDVPNTFDLQKGRRPMPLGLWGNADYGNCVKVAKYNHAVRLARLDRRRTIKVTDDMVIGEYKADTGCQSPGDPNDTGLVMLDDFRRWRGEQNTILQGKHDKPYPIGVHAFGEVGFDQQHMRAACFLLGGVEFGINLPWTAAEQIRAGQSWDDTGSSNQDAQPGSWGGHAVYCYKYDESGFWVVTWGSLQYMTNAFVSRYVDECWAVVDNVEGKHYLIQSLLDDYFAELGIAA